MPTGIGFANNSVAIVQRSGATTSRQSQLPQINIGTTQLADDMRATSYPWSADFSPTRGHLIALVEDVGADVVPNGNLRGYITKNGLAPWDKLELEELMVWGRGEIGNLKPIRMFGASRDYSAGAGSTMRRRIETDQTFAALQGSVTSGTH
jgi:hypothetical protein